MIRPENEDLKSRLLNYKFKSALKYLQGEDEEVIEIVTALAKTFDDVGWMGGNMGIIIDATVDHICADEKD